MCYYLNIVIYGKAFYRYDVPTISISIVSVNNILN